MKKYQIIAAFRFLLYLIAFSAVFIGIFMVLAYKDLMRDIGFFLLTFFSAMILLGLTQKPR
ncbi:MAG: hypothetical protein EOO51_10545 [Flavobacterium sp.]|nr:MAG: hypothetical protein EOO51_10545 [Flavobacterium sp.]